MSLFREIADRIELEIRNGKYKPGEKIPSIRRLASEFSCNKLTVHKAFELLKKRRLIDNVIGSGTYVRFPERIDERGHLFDFRTSYIAEDFFPYLKAKEIFSGLFDRDRGGALSSTPVEGDRRLIRVLGETYRLPADRILIVSGAQQGLDLTAKVFAARISDSILFEDPTYHGAISLFRAKHFVPMEDDGPDLSTLDCKLNDQVRLFYTMPAVHNPTGVSYSRTKLEAVAERAEKHPFYVIEDDFLSEFIEKPRPRFVDICPGRTIYIKSLTQTTVSGLRLGFMVVPGELYDKFVYTKYTSDLVCTGILQKFLMEFIVRGDYESYIAETRKRVAGRQRRLLSLIERYPELNVHLPQHGYNLWVHANRLIDSPYVPWSKGEEFSFSPEYRSCFRLSFMNMDDDSFQRALVYLDSVFTTFFGD
jgi:DNA-binding transcriptional MocR family regulator